MKLLLYSNYYPTYYQFLYTRKSNQFIDRGLINVMAAFEEVVKKVQIKFKTLHLAVKENERIISRNKVNKLVKQQAIREAIRRNQRFESCSRVIYVRR